MQIKISTLMVTLVMTPYVFAQSPQVQQIDAAPANVEAVKNVPPVASNLEDLPDSEKMARSNEYISQMKSILTKVILHLEEAREEKDVVKLNCVNEKLTNIKGLLKISEQAVVSLQEALARKDSALAKHEYSKVALSRQKCEQMMAESEACVGELAVYAGKTQVEVEIKDETEYKVDESKSNITIFETRPAAASPYQ